ncbi:hypothetical protein [Virgibacillus sp. JSM 102003]|uniref:hypothetical protein n=1 Tax=Virgibacillus sp. JSM 102003 TaxID=1562108 RepID=UPI0035C09AD8
MEFNYDNQEKWIKNGLASFGGAILFLLIITFEIYMKGYIDKVMLIIEFVPVIAGVVQGFLFMTRSEKDYIRIEDEVMSIHRGTFLPRKKVFFDEIRRYVQYDTLFILKLEDDREAQFNMDWLSKEDVGEIRDCLSDKNIPAIHSRDTSINILFRMPVCFLFW